MPRKRKVLTDSEIAKLREIETYEHADKKRANNPPVGMAQHDKTAESSKKLHITTGPVFKQSRHIT